MRITVIYNRGAGDQKPSAKAVSRHLKRAGYAPAFEMSRKADWNGVLRNPGAFVVAAGGDGTVTKVARKLAGYSIPLAILPIGTANNIGRSLGLPGSIAGAIESWKTGQRRRFDIGIVRGCRPREESFFFLEGVGLGLIPEGVRAVKQDRRAASKKSTAPVDGALRVFRRTLKELEPRTLKIRMEGEEIEGRYLLVEVLNISSVGPDLLLAPNADPSDRLFEVVIVDERERDALAEHLDGRSSSRSRPVLTARRAREVEIECVGGDDVVHIDGKLHRISAEGNRPGLSFRFRPEPLEVVGASRS